jgi:SAM-dependent methyltransferase
VISPDAESFDRWYRAIADSPRWDRFMQQWLGLPPEVQSSGYLTGSGLVEVLGLLGLASQTTLVELGCGRGGYGMAAARASGARLIGIDFSDAALTEARHQAARLHFDDAVEFRLGDLTSTGLPPNSADAVLCIDAFHFAEPHSAAAAEFGRLLRPGGRLVLTSWEPAEPGHPALPERLRYLDLSHELSTAGFVDIDLEPRPDWSASERALWEAAARLDPAGDPAIADLVDEAHALLAVAPFLRRGLVTARAPALENG